MFCHPGTMTIEALSSASIPLLARICTPQEVDFAPFLFSLQTTTSYQFGPMLGKPNTSIAMPSSNALTPS